MGSEDPYRLFGIGRIKGQDHSYTHVEDVEHLPVRNLSVFFKETEDGKYFPRSFTDLDALSIMQYPGNVLIKTSAGNMSHPVDIDIADDVQHLAYIYPGWSEGDESQRLVGLKFRIDLVQV